MCTAADGSTDLVILRGHLQHRDVRDRRHLGDRCPMAADRPEMPDAGEALGDAIRPMAFTIGSVHLPPAALGAIGFGAANVANGSVVPVRHALNRSYAGMLQSQPFECRFSEVQQSDEGWSLTGRWSTPLCFETSSSKDSDHSRVVFQAMAYGFPAIPNHGYQVGKMSGKSRGTHPSSRD